MAFARVSTSAADARRLGYLRDVDGVTMNRDRLLADAKATALRRAREGYQAPASRTAVPVGGADLSGRPVARASTSPTAPGASAITTR